LGINFKNPYQKLKLKMNSFFLYLWLKLKINEWCEFRDEQASKTLEYHKTKISINEGIIVQLNWIMVWN